MSPVEALLPDGRKVPLAIVHNPRARRYILRLRPDGSARLTVPRRGSIAAARRFADRQKAWLQRQLRRLSAHPVRPREWTLGSDVLFRGESVRIEAHPDSAHELVRLASESIPVDRRAGADLRPFIENHLRALAMGELPARTLDFAARQRLAVRRVVVRNQKTRWGSCSPRGVISLNWRLVQTPPFVRDYVIWHELMHLRQMNHSQKFWREVRIVCPDSPSARRWLRENPGLLR